MKLSGVKSYKTRRAAVVVSRSPPTAGKPFVKNADTVTPESSRGGFLSGRNMDTDWIEELFRQRSTTDTRIADP